MDSLGYVAHTPPENDPKKWQSMTEHTNNVASLAESFAQPFGAMEMARWVAWLHDVGKYSEDFQKYLRQCDAAKHGAATMPRPGSAEHKVAGTRLALDLLPTGLREIAAACVLGHHGGLNAFGKMLEAIAATEEKVSVQNEAAKRARADFPALNGVLPMQMPEVAGATIWEREMFIRFLFSCLVDADGLDTERHSSPEKADLRQTRTLADVGPSWLKALIASQELLQAEASLTRVNEVRREVYDACRTAAKLSPGLFSLTVPTGGGKTRSSLAFALEHALVFNRSRIIYAIPYTSIIDQTAAEFRKVLGEDSVLEHHSAMEDRTERKERAATAADQAAMQAENARDQQRKLDAENWNAPLIVTTTVQLFESLFSNRTSRCRKVHHIANSVIILDEVQTLPANLLYPLLDCLRTLIARYGVTVVLCTATQPAIAGNTPFTDPKKGLGAATAIIPEAQMLSHFAALKRVNYRVEPEPWDWEQVAKEIKSQPSSCLAILNTKNDALALLKTLDDPNARHLSTLLCGEHRRCVLEEAKIALKAERAGTGPSIRLITTQVIEAGCDIDFPRVLRARGPLDRIIQAAGRCNREGKLSTFGNVLIFNPSEGKEPPGDYVTAVQEAWMMIKGGEVDFDDPDLATEFFHRFYSTLGDKGLDHPKAVTVDGSKSIETVQEARKHLDFPLVSQKMRLIDSDTSPVLVPYHRGKFTEARHSKEEYDALVDRIETQQKEGKGLGRGLWREIQSLTVAVRTQSLAGLRVSPVYNSEDPASLYVWYGVYDSVLGIGDSVDLDTSDLIVGG
ncbi:MAG: CRISPR-associated helicase Cas3' [Janthinobacterium lividum]